MGRAASRSRRAQARPSSSSIPPAATSLPGTGDIVGVVCDRHVGGLITDATVTAILPDGETFTTTTDDNGAFGLWNVTAGSVVVSIVGEGYRRSFAVELVEGETLELPGAACTDPRLDPSAGLVSGVLCDPIDDQAFLADAVAVAVDSLGGTHSDRVDVDGRFLLGPMAPGRARITVTPGSGAPLELVAYVVAGAEVIVHNGGTCAPETCAEVTVETEAPQVTELLLVVDRSGSMNEAAPGYGTTRWLGVKEALVGVTEQLQDRVAFGLALFPAPGVEDTCSVIGSGDVVRVDPETATADAIAGVLDDFDTEPLGATPTATALVAARSWLRDHPSSRPRAVLLATDGGPNCNAGLNPNTCRCTSSEPGICADAAFSDPVLAAQLCLDDANAINAVRALANDDVATFIVGIPGVENFSDVLRRMAAAGGTLLPGTTGFYLARDRATLEGAIADIGRRVSGCAVDIVGLDVQAAGRVDVSIDGVPVPRDVAGVDGWDTVDADTIIFYGAACAAYADGSTVRLQTCTADVSGLVGAP